MSTHVPIYDNLPPVHLRTVAQLRADGRRPKPDAGPSGWLRKTFEEDSWRTELYADASTMPGPRRPAARAGRRRELTIVRWSRSRHGPDSGGGGPAPGERSSKIHVSLTGARTVCGAYIPADAVVLAVTPDWHLHTDCYNCSAKLWVHYAPAGYQRPINGSDFPIRRSGQSPGPIGGRRRARPLAWQDPLFPLEVDGPDQQRRAA
ncbi:hypothetical protein [Flindersiella endophytica]